MDKRSMHAWIVYYINKLQDVKDTYEFKDIELASKYELFLSNLAASHEQVILI